MDKYQALAKGWLFKLGLVVLALYGLFAMVFLSAQVSLNKHRELLDTFPAKLQAATALRADLQTLQTMLNADAPKLDDIQGFLSSHWPDHRKWLLQLDSELQQEPMLSQFRQDYTRLARALKDASSTISKSQLSELTHLVNIHLVKNALNTRLDDRHAADNDLVLTSLQSIKFAVVLMVVALTLGAGYLMAKLRKFGRISDRNRQLALYTRRNSKLVMRLTRQGKINYYNDRVYQLGQRYNISRYDLIPGDIELKIIDLMQHHFQDGLSYDFDIDHCRFICHLDWIKEVEQVYLSMELLNGEEADRLQMMAQQRRA